MRNFILHIALFLLPVIVPAMKAHNQPLPLGGVLTGSIRNYANQPLYLYKCYGDTLQLTDSVLTGKRGEFTFAPENFSGNGLYKITLQHNQWFYLLNDGNHIEIETVYQPNPFYNIATDSLKIINPLSIRERSGMGLFYEFQHLQQQINIANYWLLQMMRLYPLYDPFHKQIEDEYLKRYEAMEQFVKEASSKSPAGEMQTQSPSLRDGRAGLLIALAYYQPILPDWKQPDPWRDSIIALHYFDYFNPGEPFYLHTNILPEKLDKWMSLPLDNTPTSLETPQQKEEKQCRAADEWMQQVTVHAGKVQSNQETFEWSLKYLFRILEKKKQYDALYYLYDKYVQSKLSGCEPPLAYKHLQEKMSVLKNIQIGSSAPDFILMDGKLSLYQPSDYTLVLFWATWCPHCVEELPKIRDAAKYMSEELSKKGKKLMVATVSLDTDKEQWQKFVIENNFSSFYNFSEFKGWQSEVVKKYNVYATPTMFLLDKDKKIIAKPETVQQLIKDLMTNCK